MNQAWKHWLHWLNVWILYLLFYLNEKNYIIIFAMNLKIVDYRWNARFLLHIFHYILSNINHWQGHLFHYILQIAAARKFTSWKYQISHSLWLLIKWKISIQTFIHYKISHMVTTLIWFMLYSYKIWYCEFMFHVHGIPISIIWKDINVDFSLFKELQG